MKRLLLTLLTFLVLTSCSNVSLDTDKNKAPNVDIPVVTTITSKEISEPVVTTTKVEEQEVVVTTTIKQEEQIEEYIFEVPEYTGSAYTVLNDNVPLIDMGDGEYSFETYSPLDSLGRCGVAYANISLEIMPTEKRTSIGMIKPSGWQTIRYDGLVDGNYLFNRCHLIAFELAGENANERNLITGTRYMNVNGMLPFENKVAEYVRETGNHVLYRVTPVFEDDELVCRGVIMEAISYEDDGYGIEFNIFVHNIQPGIHIDYKNGDSYLLEVKEEVEEQKAQYILNTRSKKFHYPSCSSVEQMSGKNKEYYTGTREDVLLRGYDPCGRCNP